MIDSRREQLLTLSMAAREVPNRRSGCGINVSTVWRWSLRGIRGVRLETLLIGGIRYTSREALHRFFTATTAAADNAPSAKTPPKRDREIANAEAELRDLGI